MRNNDFIKTFIEKIKTGEEISPVLFNAPNLELLNEQVFQIGLDLMSEFSVPKQYMHILKDDSEKIKIETIKDFINKAYIGANYDFQIFFIENISRFTIQSANACLKFFEEPGKKNIIFLTNISTSSVLETVLSRVSIVNFDLKYIKPRNDFFYNLIKNNKTEHGLYRYFFSSKLEKTEYLDFLETLFIYGKTKFTSEVLDELYSDISSIKTNNANIRAIVDKWILINSK